MSTQPITPAGQQRPPFRLQEPLDILPVTREMVQSFAHLFVTSRAFNLQWSPRKGEATWFRPKQEPFWTQAKREAQKAGFPEDDGYKNDAFKRLLAAANREREAQNLEPLPPYRLLTYDDIARHLRGDQTINLIAINNVSQRCKWIGIDADYETEKALQDLMALQADLQQDGIDSALEESRRGGHLWIFCAEPLPAKECRVLVYNLATRLNVHIKSNRKEDQQKEGIEIFPRHDFLRSDQIGNGLRAPLGIHRKDSARYWFKGAARSLDAQLAYLNGLRKLTAERLLTLTDGLTMPEEEQQRITAEDSMPPSDRHGEPPMVRALLDYVAQHRNRGRRHDSGRNYIVPCPACRQIGHDEPGTHLAIDKRQPHKYLCWRGCSKDEIRGALGLPPARPR